MRTPIKMEEVTFPHTMDSTITGSFRSCPYRAYLQYMQHWKPKAESVHLVAGAAFAAGIEAARVAFFVNDMSAEDSQAEGLLALIKAYGNFECPPTSAKSCERMCGALEYYFTYYPLGGDGVHPVELSGGKLGIELSFALPLEINHPVSGDPLLYTGRSDLIGHFAGGKYVIDEKTTSSLGASWARQWELRSQFTGYCWACKEMGVPVDGVIVRGISILKTKYDTQQPITYRPQWEIDRWYEQLHKDIELMIYSWRQDYWSYNLDHACTEYGGCTFCQVCKHEQPEVWLETYFERRVWDPLARKQISVEEWEAQWKIPDGSEESP